MCKDEVTVRFECKDQGTGTRTCEDRQKWDDLFKKFNEQKPRGVTWTPAQRQVLDRLSEQCKKTVPGPNLIHPKRMCNDEKYQRNQPQNPATYFRHNLDIDAIEREPTGLYATEEEAKANWKKMWPNEG